ncbi:MAG: hypothetical protein R3A51_04255 [Nannocystaceae bacterium]
MGPSEMTALRRRARAAYERGRLRLALPLALAGAAPALVALLTWDRPWTTAGCFLAVYALLAYCLWRGGGASRGATSGLIAGSIPVLALAIIGPFGHFCGVGGVCMATCVPVCFGGGVAAGAFLAWRGLRAQQGAGFWIAAGLVGAATAAMACVPVGLGATAGLVVGLALAAVPGSVIAARG